MAHLRYQSYSFSDMSQGIEPVCLKMYSFSFLVGIGIALCLSVCMLAAGGPTSASGILLDVRVNPNTATVPSLVRLPGIGLIRAESIADYRRLYHQAHPDEGQPFDRCEDLRNVKGIGEKTAEQVRDLLKFE